ncbi:lytic murein transglycosylase [Ruegeria sp. 6PALISEP08]|uniref:lytic murein transglycosylase n=1 Tax=Ruegeria sp. 6PALISEP08 TaxID=1225660 RepID=UPI00352894C0
MFTLMRTILAVMCFNLLSHTASAQDHAEVERQFQAWLQDVIWPKAQAKGVSRETMEQAFAGVTLNWKLPDLVPPGQKTKTPKTQKQAEFGSPGRYFNAGSVQGATAVGRKMATRHSATLASVERETGVPGRIVLAIWGRESGYGQVPIRHDAFRVLSTKAFMSTRAEYFTGELIAALQIAESGYLPARGMKSSWAGALGQPQFMPSNFLTYARDGNGDGRADIWGSPADTIASIGHYLDQHGWVSNRDWGFEVSVPANVSCSLEGPDQGRPIHKWEEMGIRRVSGRPFPAHERDGEGFLMMPAGRHGPAFLVTPNFYVLKEYNKSDLYALFVGHVGDRIQYGVGDFAGQWGKVGGLYRSDVAIMQRALEELGHDVGGADGLPGFKTRRSIGRWQQSLGLAPTCFPDAGMKADLVP